MREADASEAPEPQAGALTAAAFVAPWLLLAFALPDGWRWRGLALLALLGVLLVVAASLAERMAIERRLDPAWWSFLGVVTLGFALAPLCYWKPGLRMPKATYLCRECDRLGEMGEPFCFGCGAAA